jgi:hypothetical protein
MKLWIDDVRPAPDGYVWCKTTPEALRMIRNHYNSIEEISLDHDAGELQYYGGDFIEVLKEMERISHSPFWPSDYKEAFMQYRFFLHSANPVGVQNMRAIIEANGWKEIR